MKVNFDDFGKNISNYIRVSKEPFIIAIAGGSGSGKGFIAKIISKKFDSLIIKTDDYYIRDHNIKNKDIPEAINLELLRKNLESLKNNKKTEKPVYTFALKNDRTEIIHPKKVIILDGIFALNEKFLDSIDFKIFVDSIEKKRFARRLERDIRDRGYTKEHVASVWKETVEPMYKLYVLPQKDKADLIIKN
jgi:uridine kinase